MSADVIEFIRNQKCYLARQGATREDIQSAAMRLGLHFTAEYCRYLSAFGAVSIAGHELTGICNSKRLHVVDVTLEERMYVDVPNDWYVVEQANIDGIVIWQTGSGEIYLTMPGKKAKIIADSFTTYIKDCIDE